MATLVSSYLAAQTAPPRDSSRQPQTTGTGTISGRVIAADTSLPIPGAQVRAVRDGARQPATARTDGQGRFVLTGLADGGYRIVASRAPFLTSEYGQLWPGEPGSMVTVSRGRATPSITVTLSSGGTISGRVFDEFGLPVVWAEVNASRITYRGGERLIAVVATELTNDRGDFRLFGLPRGDYFVSAFPSPPKTPGTPAPTSSSAARTPEEAGFAPTYYPSEVRAGMGERLRVDATQELGGIDITLLPMPLARVSGVALMADGTPMARATVVLTGTVLRLNDVASALTQVDGTFEINNVVPDVYTLRASAAGASGEANSAALDIEVAGDVLDLVLQGQPNAIVRGRIITENERMPAMNGVRVRAVARSARARVGAMVQEGTVAPDGTFALSLQPGSMWIGPVNLSPGWMLKAVRSGAADITDTGIDLGSSQELNGLTLVVTSRISSVRGTVRDSQGRTVQNATVFVFARDPRRWRVEDRYARPVATGANGQYELRGLPPGEYLAAALERFVPTEDDSPDLLERLQRGRTSSLLVTESGTVVVNLSVQPLLR